MELAPVYIDDCEKHCFGPLCTKNPFCQCVTISIDDLFGLFILKQSIVLRYTNLLAIGYYVMSTLITPKSRHSGAIESNQWKKKKKMKMIRSLSVMIWWDWCVNSLSWLSFSTCNHFSFVVVCRSLICWFLRHKLWMCYQFNSLLITMLLLFVFK